ncbi:hypothetical protein BH23BAC3_BH23BAC3_11420 [soil metagenome]
MNTIFLILLTGLLLSSNICEAQSIRKDYNEMTSDEKDAYVDALYQLNPGLIPNLANYHSTNFNTIHFNTPSSDVFLAWHRMANLEMEEAIQNIYPFLSIPYWNWITDNSSNDPLWDEDFLGQFDDEWNLGRWFTGTLPNQSNVNAVQSISSWDQYTDNLESNIVHTGAHNWTGQIMASGQSPLDPVFYLHHGMIDKLWQEWEEVNSASSYQPTALPRYPTVDPDDIVDSRDLKVWYAENGEVLLDQYDTDDTEEYRYTGAIFAEDNFIVKNGTDVTFTAGTQIVLGPGFKVEAGAEFYATVDTGVGNFLSKQVSGTEEPLTEVKNTPKNYSLSQNYPNPFNPVTVIRYEVPVTSRVELAVFDLLGRNSHLG